MQKSPGFPLKSRALSVAPEPRFLFQVDKDKDKDKKGPVRVGMGSADGGGSAAGRSESESDDARAQYRFDSEACTDAEARYLDALIGDFERGNLDPVVVELPPLPEDAPPLAVLVRDDFVFLFGLLRAACDLRPALVSCRWHGKRLGVCHTAANNAHRYLVDAGVLEDAGNAPGRNRRGTRLFLPPLDGMPVAGRQTGAVTVERQNVAPRVAVEPQVEAPDQPLVADAVR